MEKWLEDALAAVPADYRTRSFDKPEDAVRLLGPLPEDLKPLIRAWSYYDEDGRHKEAAILKTGNALAVDHDLLGTKLVLEDVVALEKDGEEVKKISQLVRDIEEQFERRVLESYPDISGFALGDGETGPDVYEIPPPDVAVMLVLVR